jgi:hypothetical protein
LDFEAEIWTASSKWIIFYTFHSYFWFKNTCIGLVYINQQLYVKCTLLLNIKIGEVSPKTILTTGRDHRSLSGTVFVELWNVPDFKILPSNQFRRINNGGLHIFIMTYISDFQLISNLKALVYIHKKKNYQ